MPTSLDGPASLDGIRERLRWAQRHIHALDSDIRDWQQLHCDTGAGEFHPEADLIVLRWDPPDYPMRWGVMWGNIAHNLRSALDHLVWQMVLAHGEIEPVAGHGGHAFPIRHSVPNGSTFSDIYVENGKLAGVAASHLALVEKAQPYHFVARSIPSELHPFALLDQLWQIDKHRHLNTTGFIYPVHTEIQAGFDSGCDPGDVAAFHIFGTPRRLEPGELLAWVQFAASQSKPDTYLKIPIEPVIDLETKDGPPSAESRVVTLRELGEIGRHVEDIVECAARTPPL